MKDILSFLLMPVSKAAILLSHLLMSKSYPFSSNNIQVYVNQFDELLRDQLCEELADTACKANKLIA